ncbi:Cysteine-histidine-rich c1 domain family protein [Thalictrum thalictroides]|uniref:Cysteine-histidine-rich c1 domain family protein n=1 Tax=Thalictrum thalictroides TaxID=46969 RepID=A0A7J6X4B5_THATH|nr:Cysteine-histidine-rich c1 domain family protein [Thalictrum thalictroides]
MRYEDVKHTSHNHNLKAISNNTPYTCDGCKETGWGLRFRCEECNYDLHKDCALSSPRISLSHQLYPNCSFRFHSRAFAGTNCNACGKGISGFVYHCHGKAYNLHPCCANLPLDIRGEAVELHLRDGIWSKCGKCSRRSFGGHAGWSYRSPCKKYHFHVSCVKDLVKDLVVENWGNSISNGGENNGLLAMEIRNVPDFLIHTCGPSRLPWRKRMNISWPIVAEVLNLSFSIILGNPLGIITFFVSNLLD